MTLTQITERISRIAQGGIITDETRFDTKFVRSIVNTYRGAVARIRYREAGNVHPLYYQKFYFEYSKDLQDSDCYVKFNCPAPISLSKETDGFRYIGTVPEDGTPSIAWQRIQNRPNLSLYNKHKVTKIILNRNVSALWDASHSAFEIYGNLSIIEGMTEAVFANPLEIPTYNVNIDNYPIPEDDISFMEQLIQNEKTNIIINTQPDLLSNSNDLTNQVKKAIYAPR